MKNNIKALSRGDILWVNFNPQQGSEIKNLHQAAILSSNGINRARRTIVVVPLSSSAKPRPPIVVEVSSAGLTSVAVCDQIRAIDKSRIVKKVGSMSVADMKSISEAVTRILVLQ